MDAIKQVIRGGRFNTVAVIVSLVVGAFSGFNVGKSLIDEAQIRDFIQYQMKKLNELFSVEENRKLLPEGVIKALVDYGPPDQTHAMEKHGPMANILNRAKNEKADVAYSRSRVYSEYDKVLKLFRLYEGVKMYYLC